MTPQQVAILASSLTPEELEKLDHATLYQAREYASPQQQGLLSPYEHRAFAREATQENPWLAIPIAAGALAYQPYKALMGARSAPSLVQMEQGLLGVGDGLRSRLGLLK